MDKNLLEIHEFNGIGYKPLIDFGTWRVAILRFIDELIPSQIERMERHNQTDEVFVLLAGQAVLFIGEGAGQVIRLFPHVMEPGKMYNVRQHTWHVAVLSLDASILLVENRDTGKNNTDYTQLNTALRQSIVETAYREIPESWGHLS